MEKSLVPANICLRTTHFKTVRHSANRNCAGLLKTSLCVAQNETIKKNAKSVSARRADTAANTGCAQGNSSCLKKTVHLHYVMHHLT